MHVRYFEATDNLNWGKFMALRHDPAEVPASQVDGTPLNGSGRKFGPQHTLIVDLQTGEGAAFLLDGGVVSARCDLEAHKVWVCPMYEVALGWLYEQGTWARGRGNLQDIPALLEIEGPGELYGYRRPGSPQAA